MRLFITAIVAAGLFLAGAHHADAQVSGTSPNATPDPSSYLAGHPGTTGQPSGCGWDAFENAVSYRESSNRPQLVNRWGYFGLFQYGEALLEDLGYYCGKPVCGQCQQRFNGAWCDKAKAKGINSKEDLMNNPELQKEIFKEWMQRQYQATKAICGHSKVGQQAPNGGCNISLSGLLGGSHLGGATGVCRYVTTGRNPSDGHTRIGDYVCCFKSYAICDVVAPGDPSCSDTAGSDGECGDGTQSNCKGGPAGSGGNEGGAGRLDPSTENNPTESGQDLDPGPTQNSLNNLSDGLKSIWVASLQIMTSQLTAVMMDQVKAIGALFDAKQQLEVQRLIQQKTADAHRDYHPSEQMCEIGTMVRNLANTEKHMQLSHLAIARHILKRELSSGDSLSLEGEKSDLTSRVKQLRDVFCNVEDNAKEADHLCKNKDADSARANRDINYTATIDNPMTLEIDIDDGELKPDEENVFALVNNLLQHRTAHTVAAPYTTLTKFTEPYLDQRSVVAMRGVARNSIAAIIAEKAQGPDHQGNAAPFMYALVRDMGLDVAEIEKLLGTRPSYYAQMDILTKKLYQNPNFIVNLYDKPANVTRIRTAMQAIKSMQDRDLHEAMMRREMLLSMILEVRIRQRQAEMMTVIRGNLFRATSGQ